MILKFTSILYSLHDPFQSFSKTPWSTGTDLYLGQSMWLEVFNVLAFFFVSTKITQSGASLKTSARMSVGKHPDNFVWHLFNVVTGGVLL